MLDTTNQQYKVNWNSDPSVIVSSDTYRIRVPVGRVLLGFRDVVPVSTPQQVPKDQSPGSAVPIPPAVLVTDRNGAPVQNASVHYAIAGGNGSVSFTGEACGSDVNASYAVAGADGVARVSGWVVGAAKPQPAHGQRHRVGERPD
ncbi:MAG TPA: hypothetical protein VEU73_12810 [Gemmatimonadales bacterium]|nr:hypothetical protein [Gemmatimonadales bacterium]